MTQPHTNDLDALRAVLPSLPEKDRGFASSLIAQAERGRVLSDKQLYWVRKLATPRAARPSHEIGDFSGIKSLFDTAQKHLKRPAVVLRLMAQGVDVRVKPCGPRSRYPGSCHVTKAGTEFGEDGAYFGRITPEGAYIEKEPNQGLVELLKAFAADPAKIAADHGKLTGLCCFCNRALSDERSTAVGYGPICAGHYNLPWGA